MVAEVYKLRENDIYNEVEIFLNIDFSENTKKSYEKSIREFFRIDKKKRK